MNQRLEHDERSAHSMTHMFSLCNDNADKNGDDDDSSVSRVGDTDSTDVITMAATVNDDDN